MRVSIEYSVVCNYRPRAAGVAAETRDAFPGADVALLDGSGGVFEVVVDGELVFSKRVLSRHAKPVQLLGLIKELKGR